MGNDEITNEHDGMCEEFCRLLRLAERDELTDEDREVVPKLPQPHRLFIAQYMGEPSLATSPDEGNAADFRPTLPVKGEVAEDDAVEYLPELNPLEEARARVRERRIREGWDDHEEELGPIDRLFRDLGCFVWAVIGLVLFSSLLQWIVDTLGL